MTDSEAPSFPGAINDNLMLQAIIDSLEQHKGKDIITINVKESCQFTDWMVFCTGTSRRHIISLSDYLCEEQKKNDNKPYSTEGKEAGEWIIIDFVDIVVHVMQHQTREFYALEKLWYKE